MSDVGYEKGCNSKYILSVYGSGLLIIDYDRPLIKILTHCDTPLMEIFEFLHVTWKNKISCWQINWVKTCVLVRKVLSTRRATGFDTEANNWKGPCLGACFAGKYWNSTFAEIYFPAFWSFRQSLSTAKKR